MGANGREYLKLQVWKDDFYTLQPEQRELFNITGVEMDTDKERFPEDEMWMDLKRTSTRAYKKLKDYEYDLRIKQSK